jgi:cytochrome P450
LKGRKIKEGDLVAVWMASANRDESAFSHPQRFDIGRKPNPHVGLGFGPHFCLGAYLAKLEMRLMMQEFVSRIEKIEQTAEGARVEGIQFWGWKRMPVRVTPRAHRTARTQLSA